MPVGLSCPVDGVDTRDTDALFCQLCGEALCHRCPYCARIVPTRAIGAGVVRACPSCSRPLWQCKSCLWIAPPGTVDCANPACPPGSLVPDQAPCSQLGGDSGRTGAYKVTGPSDPLRKFLGQPPRFTQVPLEGRVKGVVPVPGGMWAFADEPGRLYFVPLPQGFVDRIVPRSIPISSFPVAGTPDPIASTRGRL
jgi:hypothetical protein